MAEPEFISIRGAREHNLKGVNLEIPKKKLVVFTGVSGSGKSSLAFDTLYAEGQRRYVESLSAYARQFLGQMEKPKYDTIRGLSPTISIEQKAASNNPRSTVGTVTEVHDYLRVLYANIGVQHCHKLRPQGGASSRRSRSSTRSSSCSRHGSKVQLLAPHRREPQGRAQRPAGRRSAAWLQPRAHRRQGARPGATRLDPRQEVEARHRAGHRPPRAQARPAAAAHRLGRVTRSSEGKGVLVVTDESAATKSRPTAR
jgi:excinuclease ABC subunit A